MGATVEMLRVRLAAAEKKVARLEAITSDGGPGAEVASAFHLGTVGGSGRNVHRLNARKAAHLDRVIDAAVAIPDARAAAARLRDRIDRLENPPPPKLRKPVLPRRAPNALPPEEIARLEALSEWVLYADADATPPYPGITREECDRAVRWRIRMNNAKAKATATAA